MTEISLPWGGTTPGDSGPYSDDQWSDAWGNLFNMDRVNRAVLPGQLNEMTITNPAGTTIRVASGCAIVDGKFYRNTANVDFSVTAPGSGSSVYRIVLRKSWALQTVRLALLGPTVYPAYPSITQSDGVTWEVSLGVITITSAAAITITEQGGGALYSTALITSRQGAEADWATPQTVPSIFYPRGAMVQAGNYKVTTGTANISFNPGYPCKPLVFISISAVEGSEFTTDPQAHVWSVSANGFRVDAWVPGDDFIVNWIAFGPYA